MMCDDNKLKTISEKNAAKNRRASKLFGPSLWPGLAVFSWPGSPLFGVHLGMGQGIPTNPPSMKIYGFCNQKMLQHVSNSVRMWWVFDVFGMNPSTFGDENRDPYLTFDPFLVIGEEPHPLSKPALLEKRAGNMAVLPMIALLQIRVLFTKQSLSGKWEKVTQLICDPPWKGNLRRLGFIACSFLAFLGI